MTTLLLVRHGQSVWNAVGRWQGQADPELSELGRQQAFSASARVGTVDVVASSPQDRALTTATIISGQIGVGPVVVTPGLEERSAGEWSGLTKTEINEQYPGFLESGERPPGYEADDHLVARVEAALRGLVAEYAGGSLLVVCHGGVIKSFEQANGVQDGRVPNLSGRVVSLAPDLDPVTAPWIMGEHVQLLDDQDLTGGEGVRV